MYILHFQLVMFEMLEIIVTLEDITKILTKASEGKSKLLGI